MGETGAAARRGRLRTEAVRSEAVRQADDMRTGNLSCRADPGDNAPIRLAEQRNSAALRLRRAADPAPGARIDNRNDC
jgi:hypothetical protein